MQSATRRSGCSQSICRKPSTANDQSTATTMYQAWQAVYRERKQQYRREKSMAIFKRSKSAIGDGENSMVEGWRK